MFFKSFFCIFFILVFGKLVFLNLCYILCFVICCVEFVIWAYTSSADNCFNLFLAAVVSCGHSVNYTIAHILLAWRIFFCFVFFLESCVFLWICYLYLSLTMKKYFPSLLLLKSLTDAKMKL